MDPNPEKTRVDPRWDKMFKDIDENTYYKEPDTPSVSSVRRVEFLREIEEMINNLLTRIERSCIDGGLQSLETKPTGLKLGNSLRILINEIFSKQSQPILNDISIQNGGLTGSKIYSDSSTLLNMGTVTRQLDILKAMTSFEHKSCIENSLFSESKSGLQNNGESVLQNNKLGDIIVQDTEKTIELFATQKNITLKIHSALSAPQLPHFGTFLI
ncbi:hypothetical protein BB558_001038 [Smittium angustum]|uniref:Uncharacterized protein n=1 Tax=Smittium angustum TaxID=133377 RepID=A0A2U1JCR4_SMIAN|nr:hypothetical protein BB558_001038 [Smittium angustum]